MYIYILYMWSGPIFHSFTAVNRFQIYLDPNSSYIGNARRQMVGRMGEHLNDQNSGVCKPVQNCTECQLTFHQKFKKVKTVKSLFHLPIMEAIYIKRWIRSS